MASVCDRMPSNLSLASFADIANQLGPRIDAALAARLHLNDGCPERLREAMSYSLLAPGKRLRPILVLLAARACGGNDDAAMPAACAIEMVHTYSLIHDDLPAMDDDDLRRGRPTCHKAFDEATAILAGDGLLTLAFETLVAGVKQQPAAACCAVLARAAGPCGMVGGQMDDVEEEHAGDQISNGASARAVPSSSPLARLESIHRRKTGAMILAALQMGAVVASGTPEQIATLEAYGQRVGLAFQITDDLLDVQSSMSAMGKRVGKDAQRGKLTFPGLLGLDQSTSRARQLISEASEALEVFGEEADGLRSVAQFVLERNR